MGRDSFRVLIIDGDESASRHLMALLRQAHPTVEIAGVTRSVPEAITSFGQPDALALIFVNTAFKDGLDCTPYHDSLGQVPMIFTSCCLSEATGAWLYNTIDYLLTPISLDRLCTALRKYHILRSYFQQTGYSAVPGEALVRAKKRILVKSGTELRCLRLDEVACFFSENKIVFAVTEDGKKFLLNKSLRDVQIELDTTVFFRVSRQVIININYVKKIRQLETAQLQVELCMPLDIPIFISKENASSFKSWMNHL